MFARITKSSCAAAILVVAFILGAGAAHAQTYKSFVVKTPDGVNISAQEWGNPAGKEIVFIHGFMQSHLSWAKQLQDPELARQFRMISYDFRGHGGSDKILDEKLYNNGDKFADELDAVIKAASLKKPVLVGWSYGSRIVSDYLKKFGSEQISGINFVGGAGNAAKENLGADIGLIPKTFTDDLAKNIEATKAFIRACFEKQPTAAEFEDMLAFNMMVPAQIRGWLRRPAPYEDALKAVKVPTLVTHGVKDRILGLGLGKYLVATVPNAQASFYDDIGHSPFWEDAPRFNRELVSFVNGLK